MAPWLPWGGRLLVCGRWRSGDGPEGLRGRSLRRHHPRALRWNGTAPPNRSARRASARLEVPGFALRPRRHGARRERPLPQVPDAVWSGALRRAPSTGGRGRRVLSVSCHMCLLPRGSESRGRRALRATSGAAGRGPWRLRLRSEPIRLLAPHSTLRLLTDGAGASGSSPRRAKIGHVCADGRLRPVEVVPRLRQLLSPASLFPSTSPVTVVPRPFQRQLRQCLGERNELQPPSLDRVHAEEGVARVRGESPRRSYPTSDLHPTATRRATGRTGRLRRFVWL